MSNREHLGRLVRETWVAWAREQPGPKPSWLTGWDGLDEGQREVDMRIGEAVAAAERERIRALAAERGATYRREHIHSEMDGAPRLHSHAAPFADLLTGEPPDGTEGSEAALRADERKAAAREVLSDVLRELRSYTGPGGHVVAGMPFRASLDQLALEKYGVDLDGTERISPS